MDWARILAFVTGMVDQELLARIEYLAAENRILKAQLKGRLQLSDAERATLGEIGHRLGRKVLAEVANVARPDTMMAPQLVGQFTDVVFDVAPGESN
jgi:putative transposase